MCKIDATVQVLIGPFSFTGARAVPVVAVGAVDQDHHVRILLQLTRFAQVRELRQSCRCVVRGHG